METKLEKSFRGNDSYAPTAGDVLVIDQNLTENILYGKEESRTEEVVNGKKVVKVNFYRNGTQFIVLPNGDPTNAFVGRLSFTFGWQPLNNVASRKAGDPIRPQCTGKGVVTSKFDVRQIQGALDKEERARAIFKGAYRVEAVEEFDYLYKGKEYHCYPPRVVEVKLSDSTKKVLQDQTSKLLQIAKEMTMNDLKEPLD